MDVVFGLNADHSVVTSVYWQEGPGVVRGKIFAHGDIVDDPSTRHEELPHLFFERLGGYYTARAAQVDSPEIAEKYLGKSADLVDMLPPSKLGAQRPPEKQIMTPNELMAQEQDRADQQQPPDPKAAQAQQAEPPAEPEQAPAPQAAPGANEPVA